VIGFWQSSPASQQEPGESEQDGRHRLDRGDPDRITINQLAQENVGDGVAYRRNRSAGCAYQQQLPCPVARDTITLSYISHWIIVALSPGP